MGVVASCRSVHLSTLSLDVAVQSSGKIREDA